MLDHVSMSFYKQNMVISEIFLSQKNTLLKFNYECESDFINSIFKSNRHFLRKITFKFYSTI